MTRKQKIAKELNVNIKKIELIGNVLGFDLFQYADDKRVIYVTDSDFKRASHDSQHQLKFYKQISENLYEA